MNQSVPERAKMFGLVRPSRWQQETAADGPLRELLRVIAEQDALVQSDLARLWDDLVIETTDDWVLPYLADAVGRTSRADSRVSAGSPRGTRGCWVEELGSDRSWPVSSPQPAVGQFALYLDVWDRRVAATEDDSIRNDTSTGPDTGSRSQRVLMVKVQKIASVHHLQERDARDRIWADWQSRHVQAPRPRLAARVNGGSPLADPAEDTPTVGYSGLEDRVYRVEVHRGSESSPPTFKWSRDNGLRFYALDSFDGTTAVLRNPLTGGESLANGLVEVVDRISWLARPGVLTRVVKVDVGADTVVHLCVGPTVVNNTDSGFLPALRRWDHPGDLLTADAPIQANDGALEVVEGDESWLLLEDGIEIRFARLPEPDVPTYRTGDYWTIPARAGTADIAWPDDPARLGAPAEVEPERIMHHYIPLAVLNVGADGTVAGATAI